MITFSNAVIASLFAHFVGNPSNDDPLTLSHEPIELDEKSHDHVLNYLMKGFKPEVFYRLSTNGNLVHDAVKGIFSSEGVVSIADDTHVIANHLYDVSTHPRILAGDLFVAHIREIAIHNEYCDAVVILKAETQSDVAQVNWKGENSDIELDKAYRLDKIDKAVVIFSLCPGDGYRCLVIDNSRNSAEAGYWTDAFLELEPVEDSYFKTMEVLSATKEFIKEQLPEDFEVAPHEQAGLLNQTAKFMKEKQHFSMDEFKESVFKDPQVIDKFKKFLDTYNQDPDHSISEEFDINSAAVKKNASMFKSVIKLDKNFHLYIHGNRQLIERGFDDEKGMNYYKVYFSNEML
jgi:hypothetical protein